MSATSNFNRSRSRGRRSQQRGAVGWACFEVLEDRRLMSFAPAVNYAAGADPSGMIAADLNNDGRLDLVVANPTADSVNVLLGNGNGTFQSPKSSAAGDNPISIAVGDFNADGKLDVAAANGGTTGVSVMRGNGDGTFQAPSSISIGEDPSSIAVGDFNGDGKLDLAAVSNTYQNYYDYYGYPGYYEGRVNVLLGSGSGSFAAPTSSSLGTGYHTSATAADLNGDNIDDLVAVNSSYGYVTVATSSSTGDHLDVVGSYYAGGYLEAVTVGDFTGDGVLDLATAGQILPGLGNGLFQEASGQYVYSSAIATADFNADGKLDVGTADPSAATVSVMLGHGDGTLTPPIDHAAGTSPVAVATGDFNGDGRADVAAANAGSGNVSVLLNNGVWPAFNAPSISIGDPTITEGNTGTINAVFTVTLSSASNQAVTVNYATADVNDLNKATSGTDYQARSGQITIPAGQTSATIAVPVIGDRLAENSETFSLRLTDPTNAFIADGFGLATIVDDEPRINIGNVSKSEGTGKGKNNTTTTFSFTVSLSNAYDQAVTVNYATANGTATAGSDYQAKSGSVTFAPGETTKTITIVVIGDRNRESNETFFVDLFGPSSDALINTSRGIGTILNDDKR
jgi:hypothetical protein